MAARRWAAGAAGRGPGGRVPTFRWRKSLSELPPSGKLGCPFLFLPRAYCYYFLKVRELLPLPCLSAELAAFKVHRIPWLCEGSQLGYTSGPRICVLRGRKNGAVNGRLFSQIIERVHYNPVVVGCVCVFCGAGGSGRGTEGINGDGGKIKTCN